MKSGSFFLHAFVGSLLVSFGLQSAEVPLSPEGQVAYKAHLAKATTLVEQEKVEEAVAEVKAARTLNPKGYEAPATLALILQAAGKPQEAATAISEALKLAPAEARPRVEAIAKMIGPEAVPVQATQPAATATPAAEKKPATALTGAARRKYDTLLVIVGEADQAKSSVERKKLLEEFLTKSAQFVGEYPDILPVWVLRAGAALEMEQENVALVAGSELLRLGAEDMEDPKIRQLLAKLERKGWLKTPQEMVGIKAAEEVRAKEARAAEEKRLAAEQELAMRREVEEEGKRAAQKVEEERQRAAAMVAAGVQWKTMLEKGWQNSLGMKFVPVPNTEVLFCVWETRVQDYKAYLRANGQDSELSWSWQGVGIPERVKSKAFGDSWEKSTDVVYPSGPTYPVISLDKADILAFCEWLTKKERAEGRLHDQIYRLPTVAEWKAAAGSDSNKTYLWGNEFPPRTKVGNLRSTEMATVFNKDIISYDGDYRDGYAITAPVGSYAANKFGIFDMIGNVEEPCFRSELDTNCCFYGGSWDLEHPSFYGVARGCSITEDKDFGGHDRGFRIVLARPR